MTRRPELDHVWRLSAAAMLLVDEAGQVVRANRAARGLGLPGDGPLVGGDRLGPFRRYLKLAAGGTNLVPGRVAFRQGGDTRTLRCQACRYPTTDGGVLVLVTVSSAPKDRRFLKLNQELHDAQRKLRKRAHRQEQDRRMLEAQKLESLGVLAGGIAHDFNNLLVAVLGNVGLAKMEPTDTQLVVEVLDDAEEAAQQAADLCRQLLAYSGRGRFVVEPVDVSEIVRAMAQLLRVGLGRGVRLHQRLGASLPLVEADVIQLRQVVMNLITNASEAIGDGEGIVRMVTDVAELDTATAKHLQPGVELPGGTYVMLEVSDTGSGMDAATVERIFDPFYTTKFAGRGLGLAAVMGIIRAHHGALRVYSEPGHGTTMRVWLPATDALGVIPESHVEPARRAQGTVLVVDDEERVRVMAQRVLERAGFDVLLAEDGESGLSCYARHQHEIGCVLLDLTMPGLCGEEVFSRLRREDKVLRIVMSSGFSEQEVSSRLPGKRVDAFLAKPWTPQQLLEAVQVDDG